MVRGDDRRATSERPWWFQRGLRSPKSAFLLGGGWLLVAVINLILLVRDNGAARWLFAFGLALALVLGAAVIASGITLRREKASGPPDPSP